MHEPVEAVRREPRHYVHSFFGPEGRTRFLLDLQDKTRPIVIGKVDEEQPSHFVITRKTGLPILAIRDSFRAHVEELREIVRTRGKLPAGTKFPPGFR